MLGRVDLTDSFHSILELGSELSRELLPLSRFRLYRPTGTVKIFQLLLAKIFRLTFSRLGALLWSVATTEGFGRVGLIILANSAACEINPSVDRNVTDNLSRI